MDDIKNCQACKLKDSRKQVVVCSGKKPSLLMMVGEAPGADEDSSGEAFVGMSGQILNRYLEVAGIERQGTYIVNTVRCRPPGNRDPEPEELEACRPHLLKDILDCRPRIIATLGRFSGAFFASTVPADFKITQRHGGIIEWVHPADPTLKCLVIFLFHPAYVARCEKMQGSPVPQQFADDVCAIKSLLTGGSNSVPCDTGKRVRKPIKLKTQPRIGWHVGNSIVFIGRDENERRVVEKAHLNHYFFIYKDDITPKNREQLGLLLKDGVMTRSTRVRVKSIVPDPEIPAWIRVYPEIKDHYVSKEVKQWMPDELARRYSTVSPVLPLARAFEGLSIRTFEADVTPLRRFMTDNEIELSPKLNRLFVDIETDDSSELSIQEMIGNVPILSISCQDDAKNKFYMDAKSTASHHERDLLRWFVALIQKYDVIIAWNGNNFDFPFLWKRLQRHSIEIIPTEWIWHDALVSFRKHHRWDAEGKSGFSLDNVSKSVLGEGKVERAGKVSALFQNDRPGLRKYNEHDTDLLARIEWKTNYCATDQMLNLIGNCFASNPYVSMRIDGMALINGYQRGTHFRTKYLDDNENAEQYTGAFVLDPIKGRFDNVANFDFSSLYPSCMTTWNISPDSYIPNDEASAHDPADVIRCPVLTIDGKKVGGTLFKRSTLGVMPTIYRFAAENRVKYKKLMKTVEPMSDEWWAYKRHEYAWKELGLSMYGVIGSIFSRYYNRAVAEAVTLSAQYLIRTTMELAKTIGYQPLYGDTDSVFIQMKSQDDVPAFLEAAKKLYGAIGRRHNCVQNMIELEYEQFFKSIVLLKKKRYFGHLIVQKDKPADAIEIKGLEMRRSDGIAVARQWQSQMVEGILRGNWDLSKVKLWIDQCRRKCAEGNLKVEDIQVTQGLSKRPGSYKVKGPHVRLAEEMIAAGKEIYVGSKIAYVVVDGSKSPVKVISADAFTGVYDIVYIWMKKILPCLERILCVLWPNEDWSVLHMKRGRAKNERHKKDLPVRKRRIVSGKGTSQTS